MSAVIAKIDESIGFGLTHFVSSRNLQTFRIVLCSFIEHFQLTVNPCDAVQNFRWPVVISVAPRYFKSSPKHGEGFRDPPHVSEAQPQGKTGTESAEGRAAGPKLDEGPPTAPREHS